MKVECIVVGVGEQSTAECVLRCKGQCDQVTEVRGISPAGKAFQHMLSLASRPYFIQVDADMMLKPGAVKHLVERMDTQPDDVIRYAGWLWGDTEQRPVGSVCIYRTQLAKTIPFREVNFCDKDWVTRAIASGLKVKGDPRPFHARECMGVHFSEQTPERLYSHWFRLVQRARENPKNMQWVWAIVACLRGRASMSKIDDWKVWTPLIGAVAGLANDTLDQEDASVAPKGYEALKKAGLL